MAIPWGLVTFVIGIAYGALKPGWQDKGHLFRQGLFIGIVLAVVVALIGFVSNYPALGLVGFLGIVVTTVILSLLFVVGVWIGDMLSGSRRITH